MSAELPLSAPLPVSLSGVSLSAEDRTILEKLSQPLAVGPVNLAPRLILAPMSGVTNSPFRRLVKELNPGAVGLVVTEFISIEALTRENKRSVEMLRFQEGERPIGIQIFGNDIDRMVDAAKMAEDAGAEIVDINSGCPVPKVVRRGGGCELMRRPDHMAKLLPAVKKAISVPLTLKIRSGWDDCSRNGAEIGKIAEESGVELLTVHGRTRVQQYRGLADWDFIGSVAAAVKIPVVGSGDVVDAVSAYERMKSGASALMIGRGALSRPWVFTDIARAFRGEEPLRRPLWYPCDVMERYCELLSEELPERAVIGKLKQLASQSTRNIRSSAFARRALCHSKTVEEFLRTLRDYRAYLQGAPLPSYLEAHQVREIGQYADAESAEESAEEFTEGAAQ